MGRYSDFEDGVKLAAFEHAVECGDLSAIPEILTMGPHDRTLHVNAWWKLAIVREPHLKELLVPDFVEPLAEPEVRCDDLWAKPAPDRLRRAQKRALHGIWQRTFRLHHDSNRDLSNCGRCSRNGIAALYAFSAAFRHYRKQAGIKGWVCEETCENDREWADGTGFNPRDSYVHHMETNKQRIVSTEHMFARHDEFIVRNGGDVSGLDSETALAWEHQLIQHRRLDRSNPWRSRPGLSLSLTTRLAIFKHTKHSNQRYLDEQKRRNRSWELSDEEAAMIRAARRARKAA